jgi:long-chain acyl-CoA synthetase
MEHQPWLKYYDPGVPQHLHYPPVPVFHFLDEGARRCPKRLCIIFKGEMLTYAQVATLTDRAAASLRNLGIHKGERVGLFMPNCPEFILAYFAILKAGGAVVATNPLYTPPEIVHQVNDASLETVIAAGALYKRIKAAQPGTKIHRVILAGEGIPQADDLSFKDLLIVPEGKKPKKRDYKESSSFASKSEVGPEDVALLQYTGGTTGIAKGAVALHRNLIANALQFKAWMSTLEEEKETFLLALPIYHIYGMVCGMLLGMALRATLVILPDPRNITDLLAAIQAHHVTYFPAAPTLYNAINNHPDVQAGKADLTSVKACISGSAPLRRQTKEKFENLTGGRIVEGYGLSEAPTATHCNPLRGENRFGSIGLPLPDVDARIVSLADGKTELLAGQAGELVIKSPQVMRGYFNMPEETSIALRDGWLFTGDIARMDAQGYFYIVDRKKDLIKPGGMEVWPGEVEAVIAAHPKVAEVAVAGIPDDYRGETVKAWVVIKPGELLAISEVQAWCRRRLAPFKVPTHVEFLSQFPKSAVGKILKRELIKNDKKD